MKKFFMSCILTGIMAAAGSHFVSALEEANKGYLYVSNNDATSKEYSNLSYSTNLQFHNEKKEKENERKEQNESKEGVLSKVATAFKNAVGFALKTSIDVAKTTVGVALGIDLAIRGKKSFTAKTLYNVKDYAQNTYNEAKQYTVNKFNEGKETIRNKVIEHTRGKDSWNNTYNYFANDGDDVDFVDVMKETANNGVEFSKNVASNVYNKAKDVVNKVRDDWFNGPKSE